MIHPKTFQKKLTEKIQIEQEHKVFFTRSLFTKENETLLNAFEDNRPVKALVLLDRNLLTFMPKLENTIQSWFENHNDSFVSIPKILELPGGEAIKNDWRYIEKIWGHIEKEHLCRHSYIIAIGGGSLMDAVGFAASTAHRGIRIIRVPTTCLAQADSGVGVKNGVNRLGKKNWIGNFSIPKCVINDSHFLEHIPYALFREGLAEAIKVSLIKKECFFSWIEKNKEAIKLQKKEVVEELIYQSASLHFDHICNSGDPFEIGSSRPLDFGHWSAHKLEQISSFAINHGEAVSIGIAVDICYAHNIGMLSEIDKNRILNLLIHFDFTLYNEHLDDYDTNGKRVVIEGIEEFREHLGGELSIPLLTQIGSMKNVHKIDKFKMAQAFREVKEIHLKQ